MIKDGFEVNLTKLRFKKLEKPELAVVRVTKSNLADTHLKFSRHWFSSMIHCSPCHDPSNHEDIEMVAQTIKTFCLSFLQL